MPDFCFLKQAIHKTCWEIKEDTQIREKTAKWNSRNILILSQYIELVMIDTKMANTQIQALPEPTWGKEKKNLMHECMTSDK